MWPTSTAYTAAAATHHRTRSRAELWRDGTRQTTLTVTGGTVTVDRTHATRRTITATLLDPTGTLTPNDATDLLTPAGTQIKAWRGIVLPDGTTEDIPLGVFRLIDPTITTGPEGGLQIDLSGQDEAATVTANRLTTGWQTPAGTLIGTALTSFLTTVHPDLDILDQAPGRRLVKAWTPTVGADSDPWAEAVTLAAAYSLDLNINPTGVCVIRPLPTPTTPAMSYRTGPTNTALRIRRVISSEKTYSGVVVTGEPPDKPAVTATAWDTNPTSPTYYKGRFGARPFFITSSMIATQAEAQAAADDNLPLHTGILESLEIDAICNPALDVWDLITVTDPDLKLTDLRLMVDALTLPLTPDAAMTITATARALPTTPQP